MLKKKKIITAKKNNQKKLMQKISNDNFNTVLTTQQKTFTTIEETYIGDNKNSSRTTQHTSRRECLDRMEANKLSPFSSPDNSVSPKQKKSDDQMIVKPKPPKKIKKIHMNDLTNNQQKCKSPSKNTKNVKTKIKNTEIAKAEFQNEFIKRMHKMLPFHEKKITQLSEEEMEASLRKTSKGSTLTKFPNKKQVLVRTKKNKQQIIREMHMKIKQKCKLQNPTLNILQIKVLSAIILLQKLWKQTKVKSIIGQFLSPRLTPLSQPCTQTFGKILLIRTDNPNSPTRNRNDPSSQSPNSISQSGESLTHDKAMDHSSELIVTPQTVQLNLHQLSISDQLVPTQSKVAEFSKYVENYRDVLLQEMKDKRKKKLIKPNAFNFAESLSQKCLLQNLYRKRVTKIECLHQKKDEKIEITKILIPTKNTQESMQQHINQKKQQIVELEERFYTEVQQEYEKNTAKIVKSLKQPLKPSEQTVGSISSVGQSVVQLLINQFSEQFEAFSTKKCLKKKKRLPGIPINDHTISTYLNELINYVRNQHESQFEASFTKINANSLLKIFRILPQEDIFQEGEEDDEEDLNYPMLPNSTFFEYQTIYEQTIFAPKQSDRKYSNFLSGLIKIHNKCLFDCLSEYIEKERIERIELPWDMIGMVKSQESTKRQLKLSIGNKVSNIQQRIIGISNRKLGKLSKKDSYVEQMDLLASLKEDYKGEGKDWSDHQQLLQVRLELAELILQQIFLQAAEECY